MRRKVLEIYETAQNKLHCFPASPLLVSRTLRFAVLLRGTHPSPEKTDVALEVFNKTFWWLS